VSALDFFSTSRFGGVRHQEPRELVYDRAQFNRLGADLFDERSPLPLLQRVLRESRRECVGRLGRNRVLRREKVAAMARANLSSSNAWLRERSHTS
jgi:hypothetical protein